ncbi:hypothetical protein [Subtercola sp. RTI3]|uniref:hypothetical protein n=1 Tax=Subtercola sp. RTI3 TaxID=3048639 RepID=UPI002B22FD56|nr:hypothetical protein [Subtercola sp. RTI3]MEA9984273.1 hypothetical protein [Subtercola sp. RTI3]
MTRPRPQNRTIILTAGGVVILGLTTFSALPAQASPTVTAGTGAYTVKTFPAVGKESKPDDITRLGDSIYVTFQNGVGPLGEASKTGVAASTIQQYALDGTAGKSWDVTGRVDGLTADPANSRLLLTANEDGNSSFSTLTPDAASPLVKYAYTGLTHGGGTDAISIDSGVILVSGSNPTVTGKPAVYSVTLTDTTAALTPVFTDDAAATAVNGPQAGTSVTLALTDPDSNAVVPASSTSFGGDFMLTAQADMQLVFAHNIGTAAQSLRVLSIPTPIDDTAFATATDQALWLTDPSNNSVDLVTGPFASGQAVSALTPDSGPNSLATLSLTDGTLTPITELAAIQPKGMIFTAAATTTPTATPTPTATTTPAPTTVPAAAPAKAVTGTASFTG